VDGRDRGLFASLLLASLFWSIATTRRRAVVLGTQMSARFRESEERFRALNDLLPALVLMARADDGSIMYANQAATARLGERVNEGGGIDLLFEDEGCGSAWRRTMARRNGATSMPCCGRSTATRSGRRRPSPRSGFSTSTSC
jgi:PAS domain-containing protein